MTQAANLAALGTNAGTTGILPIAGGGTAGTGGAIGFKNRIINGAMVIDQRNAGASVTANGAYPVDRFYITNVTDGTYSAQQSTTAPAGFNKSTAITITSADTSLAATQRLMYRHVIEGNNIADLNWGTADAKTVTLSFWVRSSLTGTFGGSLENSAEDRSYVFTYTINSANTWEQKSITIAGDTTGTWLTDNNIGIRIFWGLGVGSTYSGTAGSWLGSPYYSATGATSVVGTNGATFYITGVQLEVGTAATNFDVRAYGTELQLCQRYLPVWYGGADQIVTMYNSSTGILGSFKTPVPVRSVVTGLTFSTSANSIFSAYDGFKGGFTPTNAGLNNGGINYVTIQCNSTSLGAGQAGLLRVADSQWMYGTGCEL